MITIRKSNERGSHQESWLDTKYSFSFHNYHDPEHMGFRALRVINQDRVAAGRGFGLHPHQDMEIFTLVLSGALEHRDNLGNREVIGPYQLQKITAGTGVRHSEVNPSNSEEVHLLQIWILPDREGLEPGYVMKDFSGAAQNALTPLLNPEGSNGAARLHQDASVFLGRLDAGTTLDYALKSGRHAWVQVILGRGEVNGTKLNEGDGAALSNESQLRLAAENDAELLLFDLS
ncbi:pirin family protein [Desulfuromonas carbonis]|uniref:pirin family protein n=1 Tax=Desulfuromonas sp. DDH964 TaxID=1823759 RepID=UPI00078CE7EE|nr:pirin family protein [Desulfuromonas sp. DDH964]AMV73841.1 pirin family protein [Desulfuromonas sp. DDH964]